MLIKNRTLRLLLLSTIFASCDPNAPHETVESYRLMAENPEVEELHHIDMLDQSKIDTIAVFDLYYQYETNVVKADNDFYRKKLVVTGFVDKIEKDSNEETYVDLNYGNDIEVRCYMLNSEVSKLINLEHNAYINIQGVCIGMHDFFLSSDRMNGATRPTLMNCSLLKEPPANPMCED